MVGQPVRPDACPTVVVADEAWSHWAAAKLLGDLMDQFPHNIATAVCGADPQLGSEWYELLGRSAPSQDDHEWGALVERISEVAANAGSPTDGLMDALAALQDPAELQALIAAMVWPETAAEAGQAPA